MSKKKGGNSTPEGANSLANPMVVSGYTPGASNRLESNFKTHQNFEKHTARIASANQGHTGGKKMTKKFYGGNNCQACTNPTDIPVVQHISPDGKQRHGPQSANGNSLQVTKNKAAGTCASFTKDSSGKCGGDHCASNPSLCSTQSVEVKPTPPGFSLTNTSGGSKIKKSKKKKRSRKRWSKKRRTKKRWSERWSKKWSKKRW